MTEAPESVKKNDSVSENGEPTELERKTLEDSESLLRFAAEYVNKFPDTFSVTFAQARQAAKSKTWTPDTSKSFWGEFGKLCDLIQPVNTDCLLTAKKQVPTRKWWGLRGGGTPVTLAERTSSRYLALLLSLLFVLIVIQLYVWMCASLTKRIDEVVTSSLSLESRILAVDFKKLDTTPDSAGRTLSTVAGDINSLKAEVVRIHLEVSLLDKVTSLFFFSRTLDEEEPEAPSNAAIDPSLEPRATLDRNTLQVEFDSTRRKLTAARLETLPVQEKEKLIAGTLVSYILPVLFGTIGALAYVIRTISDQIKRSTFAQSSPIRHRMRVALGALAGVVIGLFNTDLSAQVSLSPLALAFLAGYGVEAVFSLFDALVDKFKQPPPTQIEAKK